MQCNEDDGRTNKDAQYICRSYLSVRQRFAGHQIAQPGHGAVSVDDDRYCDQEEGGEYQNQHGESLAQKSLERRRFTCTNAPSEDSRASDQASVYAALRLARRPAA
jgi:hypothetical protein